MCLGIPGKVIELREGDLLMGRVAFGGIIREICLACTPEARVGQYVLVHAGFSISVIDDTEAKKIFSYLEEIGELAELQPLEEASPARDAPSGGTE